MEKSAEAGFDGGNALSMLFQFKGGRAAGRKHRARSSDARPGQPEAGVNPNQWALVFTQTTTVDPGEHTQVAVDAAAIVFSGILEYLSKPPS